MKRRSFLELSSLGLALPVAGTLMGTDIQRAAAAAPQANTDANLPETKIGICLNTSTIRGQKLSVPEQVKVAAESGYDSIEPWMGDLRSYVEQGGSLDDLAKQIRDAGLTVESAIGFARWIVDDPQERNAGLEEARRDMELLRAIGGKRIAAPPVGVQQSANAISDLGVVAERYRDLLEVGAQTGVVPQLELWGSSPTLSRLGELAYVAAEAGHPDACVLPDFYHIYKGGSDFAGLAMIEASRMHVFHINDYPADPPRETINDAARVYPGDGVCPLKETISLLRANGFTGSFSLELFNPEYWKQDALTVAKTGIEKTR
ncbi:MAG: sugar phosphate isomerase/epimerase, partial [Pirellulaceae bacterium]